MSQTVETTLAIKRVTVASDRSFDDVVAAVYAGLGHIGNFAAALADWRNTADRESVDAAVQTLAGTSGLIEFLNLECAPVTIAIAERPHGVALSYDRVASAIAPYGSAEAPAPFQEQNETLYVRPNSLAKAYTERRFPHKPIKVVDGGLSGRPRG